MAKIDERIVSLKFKADQFLSGIKSSLDGLRQLDAGLNKNISANGLNQISAAVKGIDLESLGVAAENVGTRFSIMANVASVAIGNLASNVISQAASMVKSFTLDPIIDGFKEYELQLNATQTILANTASKGEDLSTVTAALDELNKYADDTIYNFTEMTTNIGRFTAAGVGLKDSVAAIKGMSNLAAVMGADANQATHAMQQMSQALATGTVRLQDWMSIENASMGGQAFQDALKRTAATYGTNVDALIEKNGSFRESLRENWLTSEIMIETLTQLTGDLSDEQLRSLGYTDEQIVDIQQYAAMAKSAATEYKTFSQVVQGVQEALGSGWASFWRTMVGDLNESKALWTAVGNTIKAPIDGFFNSMSAVTAEFVALGGRTSVLNTIGNLFNIIAKPVRAFVGGFKEAFAGSPAKALATFAHLLEKVTAAFVLSEEATEKLRQTFAGLWSIVHIATIPFTQLFKLASWLGDKILTLVGIFTGAGTNGVLSFTAAIAKGPIALNKWLTALDPVGKLIDWLNPKLKVVSDWISSHFTAGVEGASDALGRFKAAVGARLTEKFEALKTALHNVGQSAKEWLSPRLHEAGESLRALGEQIKANLGAKFDALKAKVTEAGHVFAEVFGNRADLLAGLTPFGEKMRGVAESLHNAYLKAKEFADGVKAAFGSSITAGLDRIRAGVDSLVAKLKDKAGNITVPPVDTSGAQAAVATATASVTATASTATTAAKSKWEEFWASVKDFAVRNFGPVKEILEKVWTVVKNVFGHIGTALKNAFTIDEGELGLVKLLNLLLAGGLTAGIYKIAQAMKAATEPISGFTELLQSFAGVADAAAQNIKARSFLTIAAAIAVLAAALWILSNVATDDLSNGIMAIAAIVTTLVSVMKAIDKLEATGGKMAVVGAALLLVAGGLAIMAIAVNKLAKIDTGDLLKAGLALSFLTTQMRGMMESMDELDLSSFKSTAIIGVALGLYLAASAVAKLGSMDVGTLIKGTIVSKYLLEFMASYQKTSAVSEDASSVKVGSIIASAIALYIAAKAVEKLGGMDIPTLAKGTIVVGLLMKFMASAQRIPATSNPVGAGAMLATAAVLLAIGKSVQMLAEIPWLNLAASVLAIQMVLGGLSAAMESVDDDAAGGAALIMAAAGIMILAKSMQTIGGMDVKSIAIALGAMAAGLFIVITAGKLAMAGAEGLMVLAVALAGLGLVVVSFAVVLTALTALLTVVAAVGAPAFAVLAAGINMLSGTIPVLAKAIAEGLVAIIVTLGQNAPAIKDAIVAIIWAIATAIIESTPVVANAIISLLLGMAQVLRDTGPTLIETFLFLIMTLLQQLRDNAYQFAVVAAELIVNFINGIASKIGDIIAAAFNLIISFIEGLADAIDQNGPRLRAALKKIVVAIINFFKGVASDWIVIGKNIVKGIWNGIVELKDWLVNKVTGWVSGLVDGAKDALGIKSPSRVMAGIGKYMVQGLALGIDRNGKEALAATTTLAESTVQAFNNALKDGVNAEFGAFNPTVRPVLDTTDLHKGLAAIQAVDIPASVHGIAASAELAKAAQQNQSPDESMRPNITFNQTNNSPEALSEADIARQTRNLVARLEYM
jgi:tape measure domain-containing protein